MDKLKIIPMVLVVALSAKALILGVSAADAAIAVTLIGLLSVQEYLSRNIAYKDFVSSTNEKVKTLEELANTKLEEMSKAITQQNQVIKVQAEEYDKLRNSMSGIKLQFGVKDQFNQNKKLG